jgi:hypothetical protein
MSDIHKTALKLMDIMKVMTEKKKSKEEKGASEITKSIIKGAKISDQIKAAFLPCLVPISPPTWMLPANEAFYADSTHCPHLGFLDMP